MSFDTSSMEIRTDFKELLELFNKHKVECLIAHELSIYTYDAYVIGCALDHNAPLLILDRAMKRQAKILKVAVLET